MKEPDPTFKEKNSFKSILHDFLSRTTMKGVARVINSRSIVLRILWIFAVTLFMVLGVAEVYDSLHKYFSYHTVTKITHKRPNGQYLNANFPDITLCNLQVFKSLTYNAHADATFKQFIKYNERQQALQDALGEIKMMLEKQSEDTDDQKIFSITTQTANSESNSNNFTSETNRSCISGSADTICLF